MTVAILTGVFMGVAMGFANAFIHLALILYLRNIVVHIEEKEEKHV